MNNNNNQTPMISREQRQIGLIILIAMFALAAWAWMQLPAGEPIPVHWGPDGKPDRYGGKFEGLLLLPLMTTGILALMAFLPRIEPRQRNIRLSNRAYGTFWIAMALFMFGIQLLTVGNIMGYIVDMTRYLALAMGALFIVIGNLMGTVRSNYFMGIRTPWTLTSDLSWNKTHRLGGKLMMLLGVSVMLTGWLFAPPVFFGVMLGGTLSMTVVIFAYSYKVWRDDPQVDRA